VAASNHYDVLGVTRDASPDEIKVAYRAASLRAHPDRQGGSDAAMAEVNAAYEVLSDPTLRAEYDLDPAERMIRQLLAETLAQQHVEWPGEAMRSTVESSLEAMHRKLQWAANEISRHHRLRKRLANEDWQALVDTKLSELETLRSDMKAHIELLNEVFRRLQRYVDAYD